jgi:uncharacterized protein
LILVDTSGLFAALDADSREHEQAKAVLAAETDVPMLSPFVLAELDYMIASRFGPRAALALLDDVAAGAYALASFAASEIATVTSLLRRYHDLALGLADASVVVLAERHRTNRVLTLDERHFRAVRTSTGQSFTILPADSR